MNQIFENTCKRALPLLAGLVLESALCPAAMVTWTVTSGGEGHTQLTNLSNCKPEMDLIIAEAKSWFDSHSSETLILSLPPGEYHFLHPTSAAMSVTLFTKGFLIIRGAGMDATKLIFHQPDQQGILINGSTNLHAKNITLEGMHLTRDDEVGLHGVYTSQGSVTEVGIGYVIFQVDEGYPQPRALVEGWTEPLKHHRTLMPFRGDPLNPETDYITTYVRVDTFEDLGGGLCKANLVIDGTGGGIMAPWIDKPLPWPIGQRIAVQSKLGAAMCRFNYTDNCVARDLRFTRYSLNPFIISAECNSCLVERISVERFPPINGMAPYYGGPGGGCMTTAEYAGHTIRDCSFVGTGDDGVGAYSYYIDPVATGWLIEGNYVANCGRAFVIESSTSGTLRNNYCYRGDGFITMGNFRDGDISTPSLSNWRIQDNTFEGMRGDNCVNIIGTANFIGTHDDIVFERNTFIAAPKVLPMITIDYADRVTFTDNTILGFSPEDAFTYNSIDTEAIVRVLKGLRVTGSGNTMSQITTRPVVGLEAGTVDLAWNYVNGTNVVFESVGAEDGFIVESSEVSNVGGTPYPAINASHGLRAGDDSSNRQYRSIVSFDASSIPDDAVILGAAVQVYYGITTANGPFKTFNSPLKIDLKNGVFGDTNNLEAKDFQTSGDVTLVAPAPYPDAINKVIRVDLGAAGMAQINKTGRTQFRYYFERDDNGNNTEDREGFYPGETGVPLKRPQLIIVYGTAQRGGSRVSAEFSY